jgi:4-amino-4-deoxy-L-arabinose transferase-like glycosyltransferase
MAGIYPAKPQMSTPTYAIGIGIVFLLAVALRVAFWWFQARSGAVQPGDPDEYYRAALHILNGGYHDDGKWLRPPLYPAFLALMFAIGGISVPFALLGQAILSGVGVLAFVLLGMSLFERRDIGLISGLIAALFVPLASFGSVLFAEALFAILVVLGLALINQTLTIQRPWLALLCGIIWGLAALTRAVALFFIPMAALLFVLFSERNRHVQAVGIAGCMLLGAALIIGPWTLRNYLVHDRLILVDTNGGISMWYGMVQGEEDRLQGEARIYAEPNLADRQSLALSLVRAKIVDDPGLFLSRVRYKVASLFLLQSRSYATGEVVTISPDNQQIGLSAGENPLWWSLIADGEYVLVMITAIIGASFTPSWRRATPILLWVLYSVAISAITVAHHRLRLPIVGALIPFSAFFMMSLPAFIRNFNQTRHDRRIWLALGGVLLFGALIFSTRYITWLGGERHAWAARTALAQGEIEQSQAAFTRARNADPTNALRVIDLADLDFNQGQFERAAKLYDEAVTLEPRNLYAHAMHIYSATLLGAPAAAQEALSAIVSYGRDNNDLYEWAWNNAPTPAPTSVIPGDPLALGHFAGFAPATFDLARGRWTLGAGRVRVRGACGELMLRLRGPTGQVANVQVADLPIRRVVTLDGGVQTITLTLSHIDECADGTPLIVRITSPTELLDIDQAPWNVGVAVLEVQARE